ncbi:hypothetical protein [Actinoalloteichus caeruleus]|uniref:hypothetical protein n=1 Tax=Actinoalloteichus cyanogriseus TaxID=2893586 RepID=UPI003BB8AAAF
MEPVNTIDQLIRDLHESDPEAPVRLAAPPGLPPELGVGGVASAATNHGHEPIGQPS